MALKQITAADFNAAIKKLTTSDASVWWKTLGTTEEGTELCFVMGWNDGYDEDDDLYQMDGYTLCSKIGYKPSNLMVMDYTDFNMPYDKKTADVWDTDMSVGKGEVTDDAFDVKWYNDEAEAIWKKYGNPDKEGKTALDLMESKKKESLADNVNLNFKVGDFKGTQKSVISKIKKALDTKGIANEVVADGRCLEVTLDNANVVIQTIAAGGYGSHKSASYVVLAKDSDDYRKQTDAYSIKDVMDYIEDAKGVKSEAKKYTCSMQKKKESLNKKAESANSDYYFSIWSANHPENEKGPTRFICVSEPASCKGWYDVSKEYADAYEEEMELRNGNVDYTYIAKKVMDKIVSGAIKSCDDPYDTIPNFSRWFKEYPFNLNAYKQDFLDGKYGSRSESKKSEGVYGTIRVDSEDIAIKVQESNVYPSSSGRSLSVEVPKVEAWFSTLSEFSDCIDGLAENCNGYPDISRDGSDILVQINAPKEDESDDYEVIVELRCSTEIISTSLEGVVDLLNHD